MNWAQAYALYSLLALIIFYLPIIVALIFVYVKQKDVVRQVNKALFVLASLLILFALIGIGIIFSDMMGWRGFRFLFPYFLVHLTAVSVSLFLINLVLHLCRKRDSKHAAS